jgi:glutathione S-transferase
MGRAGSETHHPLALAIGFAGAQILDDQLGKIAYLAGADFSYGNIPSAIMIYRFSRLVPDRPAMPNLDRRYASISARQPLKDHVLAPPFV